MNVHSKIYVAGHNGMVGSAILRQLKAAGYQNLITKSHKDLELTNQQAVENFFSHEQPDYVFLAAARVGGILANASYPADFIYQNLAIQTNVLHTAYKFHVKRLLFLGSVCIYPKNCPQPIREEHLLTGIPELTNEPYAIAKISGIKMCEAYNRQYNTHFLSTMPTNLYGPGDNFDLETSHVLPALIRKFHEGKTNGTPVTLWGTGNAKREFLHVEDCAQALIFLMNLPKDVFSELLNYSAGPFINVGSGKDITIRNLAHTIQQAVGETGKFDWDRSKPDGTPHRILDTSRLHSLGWHSSVSLEEGIKSTYAWYTQTYGCCTKV